MSNKHRPRLDKFFNRIKTLLVAAPSRPVTHVHAPPPAPAVRHEQMEFDLGLAVPTRAVARHASK